VITEEWWGICRGPGVREDGESFTRVRRPTGQGLMKGQRRGIGNKTGTANSKTHTQGVCKSCPPEPGDQKTQNKDNKGGILLEHPPMAHIIKTNVIFPTNLGHKECACAKRQTGYGGPRKQKAKWRGPGGASRERALDKNNVKGIRNNYRNQVSKKTLKPNGSVKKVGSHTGGQTPAPPSQLTGNAFRVKGGEAKRQIKGKLSPPTNDGKGERE